MIGEPLRERLRSLDRRELIGLLVVAFLIAGGAVFWYVRSLPASVAVQASIDRDEEGPAESTPSLTPATIIVHVAGWVRRPGVYELRQGDRVIDAIRKAGGGKGGADLATVNLAALLTDGQQILVFKKGAAVGADGGQAGGAPGAGSGGFEPLVNLNMATLEQLETLPGIGPALAQRIVDHRQEHGPFRSVDDLLNVSGIGEKRLEDLRSKVTV